MWLEHLVLVPPTVLQAYVYLKCYLQLSIVETTCCPLACRHQPPSTILLFLLLQTLHSPLWGLQVSFCRHIHWTSSSTCDWNSTVFFSLRFCPLFGESEHTLKDDEVPCSHPSHFDFNKLKEEAWMDCSGHRGRHRSHGYIWNGQEFQYSSRQWESFSYFNW